MTLSYSLFWTYLNLQYKGKKSFHLIKDKVEEKYKVSIESGLISRYNKEKNNFIVNITNIFPKTTIILNAFFIQILVMYL